MGFSTNHAGLQKNVSWCAVSASWLPAKLERATTPHNSSLGAGVIASLCSGSPFKRRAEHRAAIEAIHELAHTYRLTHCTNPRCVMWFSNTLTETDRKGTRFCPDHAEALARALAGALPHPG
jgi:hypothetical protein